MWEGALLFLDWGQCTKHVQRLGFYSEACVLHRRCFPEVSCKVLLPLSFHQWSWHCVGRCFVPNVADRQHAPSLSLAWQCEFEGFIS
jgi:hypothetical protein